MKLYKYIILAWAALHLFVSVAWAQSEINEQQPTIAVEDTLSPRGEKDWQSVFFSRPALFFDRALMGEETGVYSSYGGFVGNSGNIMISGLNTVNLNASPFMVISGMPVKQIRSINPFVGGLVQNNWGFVNPLDVKTIKVIKGGYDASFYGGKAGNGLVELDFDRGEMGSASIDFIARVGFSQADYDFDVMDSEQFRSYLYAMMENRGISPTELQQMGIFDQGNPQYNHHTDWMDVFKRNGLYQDYNLKMKGGDGDTRYLFSLSYASQDETLEESDYQRVNMRFNLDYRISPKIEISNSLSYNYTTLHFNEEGDNWDLHPVFLGLTKAPFLSPWAYGEGEVQLLSYDDVDELGKSNPMLFKENLANKGVENRVDAIIKGSWRFLEKTSLTTDIDVSYNGNIEKQHRGHTGIVMDENRERQNSKRTFSEFLLHWDLGLHQTGKIGSTMNYEANGGFALETYSEKMVYGRAIDLATDEIESLNSGTIDSVDNTRYDYKQLNFYLNGKIKAGNWGHVAANLNLERNSNFGKNGSWNFYAGAQLYAHLLRSRLHGVDLDLQWGRTGNNDIRGAYYGQLYTAVHYYGYGGMYLSNLRNDDLKPEITNNFNATVYAQLWENRLNLTLGYYYRKTYGMLVQRSLPIELGVDPQFENNGKVVNQGIEFAAEVKILDNEKWKWNISANLTTLHNEVKSLPNGDIDYTYDKFTSVTREGESIGSFFGYKVQGVYAKASDVNLNRADGLPFVAGDYRFEDMNSDGIINANDRQVIGSPLPDFFGGFGTMLSYKGLSLNVRFAYSYGNDVYNLFKQRMSSMEDYSNQSAEVVNRWISEAQPGNGVLPRLAYGDPSDNFATSDRWVEDGSYLKLKNLTLDYNVPLKNRGGFVKGIQVFANANNLFTVTNYSGFDPEVFVSPSPMLRGVDTGASPNPRSYIFGVKLSL